MRTLFYTILYVKIDKKYFPYSIKDIYYKLEKIINHEIEYLPFIKQNSLLVNKDLYHVHHNCSFYLEQNHIRYLRKKFKNEKALESRLKEISRELPDQNPVLHLVQESLIESFDWTKKTGEWIIFQYSNNKFKFIGLALHDYTDKNDKRLFKKIRMFLREDF